MVPPPMSNKFLVVDPVEQVDVIKALANHVLTDKGIEGFLADWNKTGQSIL